MRRLQLLVICIGLALAGPVSPALAKSKAKPKAATTFTIAGGGFGHGIGMSQYGALGFADHGFGYQQILGHYFQQTTLGTLGSEPTVTVRLQDGALTFTGATAADGQPLKPSKHFGVLTLAGGRLQLISGGRRLAKFAAPLTITSSGPIDVIGLGQYRGSLVLRPGGSGVETVNAVPLEEYVRGVIGSEMPPSWPAAALEAQAVAARTYAIADAPVSSDFMVYSDTRSQMYRGVSAETAATDAAAAATAGQIVEYAGLPIPTFFFSSSGGYTESVQNVWLGDNPEPYLIGQPDPYDDSGGNPYYRWSVSMPITSAASKLRGLFGGQLVGVKVLKTGVSPRVVSAEVVGSKRSSQVTGPQLEQLFSTMSTYMTFTSISAAGSGAGSTSGSGLTTGAAALTGSGSASSAASAGLSLTATTPTPQPTTTTPAGTQTGGGGLAADGGRLAADRGRLAVSGTVFPLRTGASVSVARVLGGGRLEEVGAATPTATGGYGVTVAEPGEYAVLYAGHRGPTIRVG